MAARLYDFPLQARKRLLLCKNDDISRIRFEPNCAYWKALMVFDTIIEDMPEDLSIDRPWGKGNNPKTAVWQFLKHNNSF